MTSDHAALNFHKDAFSFVVAPYPGTPLPIPEYPRLDGDLTHSECLAVVSWLSHRSLWHVVRNWYKTRHHHLFGA